MGGGKYMKALKLLALIIICCFVFSSLNCNPFFDRKQAQTTVLNEDPSFVNILKARDKINAQIKKAEDVLKIKKKEMDKAVAQLKKDYAKEDKKISVEIKNLENELNEYVVAIKLRTNSLSQELKTKKRFLRSTETTIKEVNKLLSEDSQAQLSSDEETKWHDKLQELNSQKEDVVRQIEKLNNEINIEKLKLKLLN
jgi:paraquat-inducible protein B